MKEIKDVVCDDCGERVAKLEQRVSRLEEEMAFLCWDYQR
jgi:uncharacterized protein YlaI